MDATWATRRGTPLNGRRSRTLFLSDVHLATRGCRADALLDFLRHNDAETIYLVGDIVDFWRIKHGAVWPQSHGDVVQALLHLPPGPHDETHLFGNLYLLSQKDELENALTARKGPGELRIYLGYCGWSRGLLKNEVTRGDWFIFDGTEKLVFDSDPSSLWSRMIARTEQQLVRLQRRFASADLTPVQPPMPFIGRGPREKIVKNQARANRRPRRTPAPIERKQKLERMYQMRRGQMAQPLALA